MTSDIDAVSRTARLRARVRMREIAAWSIAAAAFAIAIWLGTRASPVPQLGRFEIVLPDSVSLSNLANGSKVAISNDGSLLAFSAKSNRSSRALFVRSADNTFASLVNGAADVSSPSFSPDRKWLLYTATPNRLVKIPVSGGVPVTLASTGGGGTPVNSSSWGDDNRIVFTIDRALWITDDNGTKPRLLAAPDTAHGILRITHPRMLPGSTHALAVLMHGKAQSADSAELAVVSLADGSIAPLGVQGFAPHFVAPGFVIFGRSGSTIYAAPFSLRRRAVTASPVRILDGLNFDGFITTHFDVAQNGWMAYAAEGARPSTTLAIVGLRGDERVLPFDARAYGEPSVSPDGRRLVVRVSEGIFNSGNLWIHDMQNGSVSRLTSDTVSYRGVWSRDGSRILYVNRTALETRIASRPWDGSGAETVLLERPSLAEIAPGPSGGFSAIRTLDGPRDIYLASTDSIAAIMPFVTGPADETNPRISPDGKYLVYQSNETGRAEVYLRPIPGPGARVPVSVGGGTGARWSPDGHVIYYRSPTHLMAATLSSQGPLDVVRREPLFADVYGREGDGQTFDVFPNGREFLFLKGQSVAPAKLYLVVNWQRLLTEAGYKVGVP